MKHTFMSSLWFRFSWGRPAFLVFVLAASTLDGSIQCRSPGTRWFESCGRSDPLYVTNALFAHELRRRGAILEAITTAGGHDWQSWNAAMPELFRIAERSLR